MRWRRWVGLAAGAAALLAAGGCSWIPFIGSGDGPHLTNPAVDACRRKARDLGYDDPAERSSAPGADGRYTVVLDIRQNQGYGQVTCTFDPAKGADLPPAPKPGEKPPEKPAETPAEGAPATTPESPASQ